MNPFQAPAPLRSAVRIWGVALAAYVVAVASRTSFGVAGPQAADRYEVAGAVLSLFAVLQLAVYAAAQVPVGMLLDRVGSRVMLSAGGVLLVAGHLTLALAESLPLALAARVLVGLGDSATFVSVIRLLPAWFSARRVPVLTQLTGLIGQLGQVISAVPFLALLLGGGWTPAFASLAGLVAVIALIVLLLVRDRPAGAAPAAGRRAPRVPLGAVLREPGAWLGFFTHVVTLFSTNTFMLLWGVPFLTEAQGATPQAASLLLTIAALASIVAAPVLGMLTSRYPLRRSWLALAAVVVAILAWMSVLLPDTPRPLWQLALLVAALGVGMPASVIGFDYARTFVPAPRLGMATGLVNVGGFSASVLSIFLVGALLDVTASAGYSTLDGYRLALSAQGAIWVLGLAGMIVSRSRARRRMAAQGIVVPPVRESAARLIGRRRPGRGGGQGPGDGDAEAADR